MKKIDHEDDFLKKLIKNKMEINNTPIRTRPLQLPIKDKQNKITNAPQTTNRSPPFLKNNRKKNHTLKTCANHTDRQAEFRIIIDGQCIEYCNKCAAHLASQGFQVERITSKEQQLENPRKMELNHFLNSLKNLQSTYRHKLDVLTHINNSYEAQKTNALSFYTAMMDYLEVMRQEHLKILQRQSIKHTQICEIECGEISQTLEQIQSMRDDVESNMESILGQVEEDNYRQCLSFYLQKVGLYEHRLDELGMEAKEAPHLSQSDIETRLEDFKAYVEELTGFVSDQQFEQI